MSCPHDELNHRGGFLRKELHTLFQKAATSYLEDAPEDTVVSYLSKKEEEKYWSLARRIQRLEGEIRGTDKRGNQERQVSV